jgi:putative ABC transport system permease protein
MIRNYLKIAFRNLKKHKFISFINLFGLTVGLCCCLLILAYVLHELSYDRYHSKAENIYRVERSFINAETGVPYLELGAIAPPIGLLLENDFEEIRLLTRLLPTGTTLRYEDKLFNEREVYYADEQFFNVFDVELLQGNPARALHDPFSIMLSEEMAVKYFGNEDPINKVIRLDSKHHFKVTGVFKAFPGNSHVHPQILLSFNTLRDPEIYGEENLDSNWGHNNFYTYILLPEGYDPNRLEAQFPAFLDRQLSPEASGTNAASNFTSLNLIALNDIHLHSQKDSELEENGDITRIYIFSAIALFILLIACINYMNLSTARSVLRAREIGVRKVIGAGKGELVLQFLSESVLISWVAAILAFLLSWMAFPWLNQLSGLSLSIDILLRWELLLPLLLLPFAVGVLSGIYPAFFLSSFQPVKVLKGFFKTGGGALNFRQALVVAQFAISIILIISTLVVYQQLQYMQNKALGFDREHILTFRNSEAVAASYDAFRSELLSHVHVKEVGRSSRIPSGRLLDGLDAQLYRGDSLVPAQANIRFVRADDHFMATYGIKLAAGRLFSKDFGTDTSAFIINEAAAREMGFQSAEEAIGNRFVYGGRSGQLVGVVEDFHFESMHQRILPLVFFKSLPSQHYGNISVKVSGENLPDVLAQLQNTWRRFDPETPFEYNFLDERYARLYASEQRQGTIFTLFAGIAIAIACLGLFGLSAFTISQRVKEIGIRKVLGAETHTLVTLLSKDFLKLVLVAALIAFPIAWWAMHSWLQDFAYRIDVPIWVFIAAGVLAALVAFLTVSYQAVKAAMANPVKNLRTE